MKMTRTDARVGLYLAIRQIRRSNPWTTALIIFVMVLTFLELVVITGLLVGLVQGITNLFRVQQYGDVYLSALDTNYFIEHSPEITTYLRSLPQVERMSARYVTSGFLEANYKTRSDFTDKPNQTPAVLEGVDPTAEENFSNLSQYIGEGSMLGPGDYDTILVGSQLIDRYSFGSELFGITPLKNVYPGSRLLVTVNGQTREMTVKGIIVTTANSPIASHVFMPADELSQMMGRTDYNVNEIAIAVKPGVDPTAFADLLHGSGIDAWAKVQTFDQALPNGIIEVKDTFAQIGNALGAIGLIVASVTIFIVVFINALTRRKFIGILKGIGISGEAIELAYVFQSGFYAAVGSLIGLLLVYGFIVPYTSAHPIVLPISRAIIVAPALGTAARVALLVVMTHIAGFVPARIIVRKNTLNSILGRN
jgi:ABC-type lipoprotein release transport system permease subunit